MKYKVGKFTWVSEDQAYYARHCLSNGQYCQIAFRECRLKRYTQYHVVFAVADKKKNLNGYFSESKENNLSLKMTGKCGVEALYWCKDMLVSFENDVAHDRHEDVKIVVFGEDARRRKFYEKALPRLGFVRENTPWGFAMVKTFKKEDEE